MALRALIRFHEAHPDWFPNEPEAASMAPIPVLDPEWELAIQRAYQTDAPAAAAAAPEDSTTNFSAKKTA